MSTIFQILLGLGSLGILSFILYWAGVALHAGPKVTEKQIENDPRLR